MVYEYKRSMSFFGSHSMSVLNISSEATGQIVTKFNVKSSGVRGTKTG